MAIRRATFYRCKHCGSVVMRYSVEGQEPQCCGEPMEVLEPYTEDNPGQASAEKHLPVIKREGKVVTVSVGEQEHPMDPDHYIEWVYAYTEMGSQLVKLKPGVKPYARFQFAEDIPLMFFIYCNKHGLWATSMFESMQDEDDDA